MSSSSHSTHSSSCSIPHVNTHLSAVPHLILVPQKVYRNQSYHIREPSVTFRTKGSSELGVQIFDISHVEGKRETPLPELVYRSLNVRINVSFSFQIATEYVFTMITVARIRALCRADQALRRQTHPNISSFRACTYFTGFFRKL